MIKGDLRRVAWSGPGVIGRYSNRDGLLQAPDPPARRKNSSPARPSPQRRGALLGAITEVLQVAGKPLKVSEIYLLATAGLGRPLSYKSLKDALSTHTGGRVNRVRRG